MAGRSSIVFLFFLSLVVGADGEFLGVSLGGISMAGVTLDCETGGELMGGPFLIMLANCSDAVVSSLLFESSSEVSMLSAS